jgi:hypothetical protein
LAVCFASCEKESSTYPKKYVCASFIPGPLKMFTNTGEVTDENTINQFIADKKIFFGMHLQSPIIIGSSI